MAGELSGVHVAMLVTDGFEEVELTEPRKALEDAGASAAIVAPDPGRVTVRAMRHADKGDEFRVDLATNVADPAHFSAVLLPGGALNADKLRMDPEARAFVQAVEAADKPIAVICHGPWLLVSAGLVNGRMLTSYYTLQDDVRNAGGRWLDRELVRDRNWVSSRSPADLPAFNRGMVELFAEYAMRAERRAA